MKKVWLLLGFASLLLAACGQAPELEAQQLQPFETIGDNYASDVAEYKGSVYTVGTEFNRLTIPTSDNGYLRKYKADGTLLWSKSIASTDKKADAATGVAVDSSGNIYVAGWTDGKLSDAPDYLGRDGFVRKYNPQGNILWTRTRSSGFNTMDESWAVTVDNRNDVYVAGLTWHTTNKPLQRRLDLVRYSPDGAIRWARQHQPVSVYDTDASYGEGLIGEPTASDQSDWYINIGALAIDRSGNLYATAARAYGDGTEMSRHDLMKFDAAGNRLWTYTRYYYDPAAYEAAGVALDANDNIYWVTTFEVKHNDGCEDFDNPLTDCDLVISKHSPNGQRLWLRWGLDQTTGDTFATDVLMKGDILFISGYTYGTVSSTAINRGGADAFTLRLGFGATGNLLSYMGIQRGSSAFDVATAVAGVDQTESYMAGYTYGVLPGQTDKSGQDAFLWHGYLDGWGYAEWFRQY